MGRSSRTKRDAGEKVAQRHILYFGVFMVADPSLADVRIHNVTHVGEITHLPEIIRSSFKVTR